MDDFNSETDSDYTSYWRDWVSIPKFCVVALARAALCTGWPLYTRAAPHTLSLSHAYRFYGKVAPGVDNAAVHIFTSARQREFYAFLRHVFIWIGALPRGAVWSSTLRPLPPKDAHLDPPSYATRTQFWTPPTVIILHSTCWKEHC
jgi:hypothetical protein